MRRFSWSACALGGALWSLATVGTAQVILDTAQVREALERGVQVWDVRPDKDYAKAHLPGALTVGNAAAVLREPNSEDFLPTAEVARILGAAGIDPDRETVVYGARGGWQAYFGRYTLRYFGADKVSVYHDGMEAWQAAGLPVETGTPTAEPITLALEPDPAVAVTTAEMLERVGDPDVQIVDARTPGEFAGTDIRALRGGHVPGAVNIPYEMNWSDPETPGKLARKEVADNSGMALKGDARLEALYARLDPDKETVVYCQSGARASQAAGVLEQLGFTNVRVYDSSWLGYGNRLDAPAENVTFFNVGALERRIAAMQRRIDTLEKELAEARK
ncbi:MAG: rhodanese-like domain-containing protein [Burkholderiaceae bacterium]